jgi:hypothetical protein
MERIMNKISVNPNVLQSIVGVIVLLVGLAGWWTGKDISALIPLLGAVIGYTEMKKFGDSKKSQEDTPNE